MDIRNWPLGRIMQLPDCCFGRRFVVSCEAISENSTSVWDISELALPEKAVFWELQIIHVGIEIGKGRIRLALGDKLPASTAEMDALEPLIMGLGRQGAEPRQIYGPYDVPFHLSKLRFPVAAAGRRLILEVRAEGLPPYEMIVNLVVSSIPTEAPDWLSSAHP